MGASVFVWFFNYFHRKTDLGENSVTVSYGNISSEQMPDAVYSEWWNNTWKRSYTYDSIGRISSVKSRATSGWLTDTYTYKTISGKQSSSLVSSLATPAGTFSYTYDARGNIASVSDGTYKTTYTYDNLNQLVREDNEKLGKTYIYSYLNGNITSRKEYAYTLEAIANTTTATKTDTYEYSAYAWGDLLVKAFGKSLAYTDGEITKLNGKNLTWGFLGKLTSCGDTSFTYDTSGRRLSKTTGTTVTEYYYAGDMLVGQKTGSDKIEFMFDSGGDYYGFEYNDTPYYYIKNLQGDVIAIFNDSGTSIATYTYDAWGRILATTDTSGINIATINPIRYRGYYYDTETGYYYLNARYYYPEICRFISADPNAYAGVFDGGAGLVGYNIYVYCANNSINYYDPTGEFVISTLLICVAAGAIIGGTIGGIAGNAYANSKGYTGWNKTKFILTGIGIGGLAGGALGYFAAPAVVSATGVAGISVTAGGVSTIAALGTSFGKLGTLITNNGQQTIDWCKTTLHGMQRMIERGVTPNMVESWVKTGKALQQAGDKILYITKQGAVVVNKAGKVITAYTSQYFDPAMQKIVEKLFGK